MCICTQFYNIHFLFMFSISLKVFSNFITKTHYLPQHRCDLPVSNKTDNFSDFFFNYAILTLYRTGFFKIKT